MKKIAVVFIVMAMLIFFSTTASQAIMIGFDPMVQDVMLGDPFNVDVNIAGLGTFSPPSLGAFDIDFTYDPAILGFNSVVFGNQLDQLFGSIQFTTPGFGTLNLFEVSFDPPFILDALQPDSFTLASLTFDTLTLGSSSIDIAAINGLGDSFGFPLTATTSNASATVTPEPATLMLLGSGFAGMMAFRKKMKI